ncbi:MAG: periplasmic heavy metal sensor [Desulfobacteraceae bacterium]|nr:MAG: periplasmic heavy metal sensor [Desulfobacteraceae bacterium]
MKKKIIIVTGVLTILTVLFFTACNHYHSPESRIGWIKDELTDRLALDAGQQARLDAIAAGLLDRGKQMRQEREAVRATLMAELKKEHIDRSAVETLVAQKQRQMDAIAEYLIDSAIGFHETLSPEQREKLVAELEKFHARAEKYRHRRW